MFVVAAALLGLIVLLATLQYQWLGQVSAAERERMKANLATRATAFAQDFDREVTRAYLTFQVDPVHEGENLAGAHGDPPRPLAGVVALSPAGQGHLSGPARGRLPAR